MATKKFKKLPKDSQRAAFAQMDKDGTRNDRGNARGGGSIAVKTLSKNKTKLPHITSGEQMAVLDRSLFSYEKGSPNDKARMKSGLEKGEIHAEQTLRLLPKSARKFDELASAKKQKDFLGAARAFRILTNKRGKK